MMNYVEVFMVVISLASIYESAYGQSVGYGHCPDVSVMHNFDPYKYTGRWFEAERVLNPFELGGSCVTADYTAERNSFFLHTGNLLVTNTMRTWFGFTSAISGKAVPLNKSSPAKEAKYVLSYNGLPNVGSYWVLDTDYDSHSVVYSCSSILGLLNLKYVWLLTRAPQASQHTLEDMRTFLQKNKDLASIRLFKTNQENCQYS